MNPAFECLSVRACYPTGNCHKMVCNGLIKATHILMWNRVILWSSPVRGGRSFCLGLRDRDMVAAEEPTPCLSAPWAHAPKGSGGLALAMRHCRKRGGNPSSEEPRSLWGTSLKLTRFHSASGYRSISDLQGRTKAQSVVSRTKEQLGELVSDIEVASAVHGASGTSNKDLKSDQKESMP